MNDITIVDIVSKGEKNTRYLVRSIQGEYYCIMARTGSYGIGDVLSGREVQLLPAEDRWVAKYENNLRYPRKQMMSHLEVYKKEVLKNTDKGIYNNREYDHIFVSAEQNMITGKGYDSALREQFNILKEKGELRSDFSHLTSSQAFAVNFLSPLIAEKKLLYLDDCFEYADYPRCIFEEVLDSEEKTQFDFFAYGQPGHPSCSIEVKYSEYEFGATFADPTHLDKYGSKYDGFMEQLASVERSGYAFFEYYQIWRNLIYTVKEGQHVCFFFPAFRQDLKEAVGSIVGKCKEEYKHLIHVIIADEVADRIIDCDGRLAPYYQELKKKYLLIR